MGKGWNSRVVRVKIAVRDIYDALFKKTLSFGEREVIRQVAAIRNSGYGLHEDDALYHIDRTGDKLFLRKQSSDLSVFEQIYLKEEYKPLMAVVSLNEIEVKTIVDIGSNIGLASHYFSRQYPDAFFICIEPDRNNFAILKKNTGDIKNAKLYENAIWNREQELSISKDFRDGQDWSLRVDEKAVPGTDTVSSITIGKVIEDNRLDRISILKIDIEGAEFTIFESLADLAFLHKVEVIAIEVHEDVGPKSLIVDRLVHFGFILFEYSETIIGINIKLIN